LGVSRFNVSHVTLLILDKMLWGKSFLLVGVSPKLKTGRL